MGFTGLGGLFWKMTDRWIDFSRVVDVGLILIKGFSFLCSCFRTIGL